MNQQELLRRVQTNDPQERIEIKVDEESYSSLLNSIKKNMSTSDNPVLLIDDERGIRKMVARSLKNFATDIKIYEANNGKEGLEKLATIRKSHGKDPLLIVLDLNMPIMNGWDFISTLKKEYDAAGKEEGIPILVLSSTSGEKGALFMKKSVHGGKSGYTPLVTIAKETCVDKSRYDSDEKKGLNSWLKFFIEQKK